MSINEKFLLRVVDGNITKVSKSLNSNYKLSEKVVASPKNNMFRNEELFVPFDELDSFVPRYSLDDLPLASSLKLEKHRFSNSICSRILDTDLSSTTLIGTNRVVYFDSLMGNLNNINKKLLNYMFEAGHSLRDACNVFYKAKGFYDVDYLDEAFSLLKKGHPLEKVLGYMDASLLVAPKRYSKGLMMFIAENPNKKSLVVIKDRYGNEVFDAQAANNFHILETICKSDEEILDVLKACRRVNKDGISYTEDLLSEFALDILTKNQIWTDIDSMIFNKYLKRRSPSHHGEIVDVSMLSAAKAGFRKGLSSEEVLAKLNRKKCS